MPNSIDFDSQTTDTLPPSGDNAKAEKYLSELIPLIQNNRVVVTATDLSTLGTTSLLAHYQIDIDQFRIEFGHSNHKESNTDSYLLVFNRLEKDIDGSTKKVVLAYVNLTEQQFASLKDLADKQITKIKQETEEKRFAEAMAPIDQILQRLSVAQTAENTLPTPPTPNNQIPQPYQEPPQNPSPWVDQAGPVPTFTPTPIAPAPSPIPFQTDVPTDAPVAFPAPSSSPASQPLPANNPLNYAAYPTAQQQYPQ